MAKVKPGIPQGTRDFSAEVVKRREYIIQTIRSVFELYGFQPLETPALENLETLLGKYGDEGDKLIFKILNNGLDNPTKRQQAQTDFEKILEGKNVKEITERALRYDLTIPFARYVAMNQGQLTFPFRRYQIQPVWRADRPQKGRYREFYQCDADVVGSHSLWNEIELVSIYASAFENLGIDIDIKINNRKILAALAARCERKNSLAAITIAIDKLDKVGLEKVKEELQEQEPGLDKSQIDLIEKYLLISGTNQDKISQVESLLGNTPDGRKGIEEIKFLADFPFAFRKTQFSVDFTLARGLNYYTGVIFEVKARDVQMGSIGGGGRYDDLTGSFGVPDIPGVGISFGLDRIYDVMEELNLFPAAADSGTRVLFFNLGETESRAAFALMQQLRRSNVACELFHENARFDKQFRYAEKKNIPYIIILGSKELETKTCTVKNIRTGVQQTILQTALLHFDFGV